MADVIPLIPATTPTVTEMDRVAEQVRAAVEAVAALIPRLERPHPGRARQFRAHRTVPRDFVRSMIAAVDQLEGLRNVQTFDAAEAEETLQFIDAFRPVADQLAALTAAVRYTMEIRKSHVVDAALQTYDIARALARDGEDLELAAQLDNLKRDLRRQQRRGVHRARG